MLFFSVMGALQRTNVVKISYSPRIFLSRIVVRGLFSTDWSDLMDLHGLLFADYCSRIFSTDWSDLMDFHGLLFADYCSRIILHGLVGFNGFTRIAVRGLLFADFFHGLVGFNGFPRIYYRGLRGLTGIFFGEVFPVAFWHEGFHLAVVLAFKDVDGIIVVLPEGSIVLFIEVAGLLADVS